jgi:hypothetical protein
MYHRRNRVRRFALSGSSHPRRGKALRLPDAVSMVPPHCRLDSETNRAFAFVDKHRSTNAPDLVAQGRAKSKPARMAIGGTIYRFVRN